MAQFPLAPTYPEIVSGRDLQCGSLVAAMVEMGQKRRIEFWRNDTF
jgi:hypothetical protein